MSIGVPINEFALRYRNFTQELDRIIERFPGSTITRNSSGNLVITSPSGGGIGDQARTCIGSIDVMTGEIDLLY